jgi:hypothetical protein
VGIPLDARENITDITQLGLDGAEAAQFRVLERDRSTGRIRWVLADFLADSPGGSYALVDGGGNVGGANLAADHGARIVVTTGAACFEIRRNGFNLLDRVLQGNGLVLDSGANGAPSSSAKRAQEVVSPHAGGGLVVRSGGTRYESGLDDTSDVVIEENGPVKAVVRAHGTLRSTTGGASLDYTVRLHFYRGQACCRVFGTLRNADIATPAARTFDAAWIELPLHLETSRRVTFGAKGSVFTGDLGRTDTAYLFQGDNTFQRSPRTDGILPYLTNARGLEIGMAGRRFTALGATADIAAGWMSVEDSNHRVLAGMRDFASHFPSGLELHGDSLSVEVFSRRNPQRGLVFSWGAHETREILLQFSQPGASPEDFRSTLQNPLVARCQLERYRDTGAFCGEHRLVSVAEEKQFFAEQGRSWNPASYAEADLRLDRQYDFGTTGGPNQFDRDECNLLDFARGCGGGNFLQARLSVLWKADQAVTHSDDFDYGTHQNRIDDIAVVQQPGFDGKGAGNTFDDEHPHWVCMLHYYHMTGDEHVREAIEDYGEWRLYRAGNPTYGPIHGAGLGNFRLWSRCLRDVALLYELTGQPRYLDAVHVMGQTLTTTLERDGSRGRNLERGYFFFGSATDPNRFIHLFFLTEMNALAVQEAMRVLPSDDPLKEELRDYLYGLAYFTLQEAQISPTANGYPYEYMSAVPNTVLGARGDQTGLVLTHGYEMSGDPEFVKRSRALAYRVPQYQSQLRGSELSTHLRIYRWLHRDEVGALFVHPQVRANGDGSYTLQFPAPAGAREYIVKYGPRPPVENLGFDQQTRTYRVDPANAMNFWAASNLAGEPRPGPKGSLETFTTTTLPAGHWYFEVKVLTDKQGDVRPGATDRHENSGAGASLLDPACGATSRVVTAIPEGRGGDAEIRFSPLPPRSLLQIYSVTGRLVRRLSSDDSPTLIWDRRSQSGAPVAPGLYFFQVQTAPHATQRGRVLLLP